MITQALPAVINLGGGVLDARGVIPHGTGAMQLCDSDHSNPFAGVLPTNISAVTVLLPPSTIEMTGTWTLPNNIRLVGEGANTILKTLPGGNCCTSAMIEMGETGCPNSVCSGISIEYLQLVGTYNGGFGGIENRYAQSSSYVNNVGMSELGGTGLTVGASGSNSGVNSGPYTNISFSAHPSGVCDTGVVHPSKLDTRGRVKS
jgi:hypothetical protein